MTSQIATATLSAGAATSRAGTVAEWIGARNRTTAAAAAATAGVAAFVAELPEGYDTHVGGDGVTLSPSQRLGLDVARLLVLDPDTVVVDDPTAGLDAPGEATVLPGLHALLADRHVEIVRASPAVAGCAGRVEARGAPSVPVREAHLRRPPVDPSLPTVHDLLDATAMAPLLATMLHGSEVPDVRVTSVRYKPADNVVVRYAVSTERGWATAVAYATADSNLRRKRKRPPNRRLAHRVSGRTPAAKPLRHLRDVDALVQWLPLDLRLPLLADDAARLGRRLTGLGLVVPPGCDAELLRYWPRRRAVVRLGPHVVKVYREATDYSHAVTGLRAGRDLRRVRTAKYEGRMSSRLATVQGFVPGGPPGLLPGGSEPAGALLADLHGETLDGLPETTTSILLQKSASRADFVEHVLPELAGEVRRLLADLRAGEPSSLPAVTSHGNFHAGQIQATPSGLVLIDLDRLCRAAPAFDVASFAAHLAFGRPGEDGLVAAAVDSLVRGYRARPRALEWFLACSLLRRTAVPFRYQDDQWPQAVAELVRHAREVLR